MAVNLTETTERYVLKIENIHDNEKSKCLKVI
jgi:hypothetical protein